MLPLSRRDAERRKTKFMPRDTSDIAVERQWE